MVLMLSKRQLFNANMHCCLLVRRCMHAGRSRSAWQNPAVCVYILPQVVITVYLRETLIVDTVAKKNGVVISVKNGLLSLSEAWHHMRSIVGMFFFPCYSYVGLRWGVGGSGCEVPFTQRSSHTFCFVFRSGSATGDGKSNRLIAPYSWPKFYVNNVVWRRKQKKTRLVQYSTLWKYVWVLTLKASVV